jgi:hypothetical protein
MPEEATQPGATAFTRTPLLAHSKAALMVRLLMPARRARVAHAGHAVAEVRRHVDDRAAVRLHAVQEHLAHHQKAAREVVAHHGLEAALADGLQRRGKLPARVVDQSGNGAHLATMVATAALTASSSRMSKAMVSHRPPSSRISWATRSSFSWVRPLMTTRAPRRPVRGPRSGRCRCRRR